jgi:hypothetical protein
VDICSSSLCCYNRLSTRKTAPDHYSSSTVIVWHSSYYTLGQADSSLRLPDGEVWFITPENEFPLLQSPMAASFTPLQPALGTVHDDLRLVCGCSAMEAHFMKLLTNSYCADVASRGSWYSVVSVSTNNRRFLHSTRFSTQRSPSVSLCRIQLRGWAIVAPRLFHFTITALTVDRCNSSRAKFWQTDLLERWHPMMVPCWMSLSSSVRPFYCQCVSIEIIWLWASAKWLKCKCKCVLDFIHLSTMVSLK